MSQNKDKLIAKDIDGKRIREQYFDGILIGFFVFIVCYIVWSVFDTKNFIDNLYNAVILFICFSSLILLSILNRFVFGNILCILSEDKLYYFNAETIVNSKHNKTNGYIEYKDIEKVQYISSSIRQLSRVIISGANFEITVLNANRNLVKEINKRR